MRAHPAGKLGEGATAVTGAELCERQFQSTPPRGGDVKMLHSHVLFPLISIHAPREGGDADNVRAKGNRPSISIHAPREEGRPCRWRSRAAGLPFQSTPPARGATRQLYQKNNIAIISIHAPREGGDKTQAVTETKLEISIHAPREGGDGIVSRRAVN